MDLAFGTATEDMDALTFGTKFLLRGFNGKKEPVTQIDLSEVLKGFEMTQTEFIDLCIMCGCDYTQTVGGMGPVTAYKMIKEHQNIEGVLKRINEMNEDPDKKKKYMIPGNFLYKESRELFVNPDVNQDLEDLQKQIVFGKPDEAGLKDWLCTNKGFTEIKVSNGIERMNKCAGKKNQSRLDSFFKSSVLSSTKKVEAPKGKGKGGKGKPLKQAARKSAF